MPNTSALFPHVGENVTGIGTIAWSNPGNLLFGDLLYASVTTGAGTTSNYLQGRDYRFTLNPGSTINGIIVVPRVSCSGTNSSINLALVDDTGTIIGTPKNQTITGSAGDQNYTIGNTSDLWGATITPTIVNNANFGVRMWHTGAHSLNVDWITIQVAYTPGTIVFPADPGNYPYNSLATTSLEYNRAVPADPNNYPFNALSTTNFVYILRIMSALPNTYPYTGIVDTILVRIIPATPSNYPYNNIPDTNLVYELRIMPAAPNNYPFNALSTTTLARVYSVPANPYTYSYNTYQAGLSHDIRSMQADPKTFPYFGYDVAFNNPEHVLPAVSYTYPFFGYDATLTKIIPASTEIVFSGLAVGNYKYIGEVAGIAKLPIRIEYDPYATGHTPVITFQAPIAENFTLTKTTINRVVGSTVVPLPDLQDRKTEQVNGSDTFIEYQLNVPDATVSNWRSADTNIATVNGSGAVSWVSNGLVNIIADTTSCSKLVFCNVSKLSGVSGPRFVDWIPGTLAYKISHDYDAIITGTSVAAGNGEGLAGWTPLKRNMNNWATRAGIDLSAIGILNQIYAGHCELTMITPRHCITADHAKIPANTWGQWLANDGTDRVCQRTITSFINPVHPPPASPNFMDLRVYQLDSDVDDFIGHVKFLPPTSVWAPRLPSIGVTGLNTPPLPGPFYLPLLIMDQKKKTVCRNWYQDYSAPTNPTVFLTSDSDPTTYPRLEYLWNNGHAGISGDSGSPQCLIIDGQLVCHSLVSSTTFVNLVPTLQAAIDSLGNPDHYQIEVVDITSYPTF